ncbi:Transposon Tf2-6 polyprotein [Cucumis melo var. makuwa]|uniref:Transposon Tf2-6 polyprotein n=1 Tax=Cucumis melo var. makuwa TaxID=1194695 RepID=A0A5A7T208_CUCMM|nr:Transposon Tf2-6 polyprotein [Cucumis melo var. makuwa]TYK31049.1 Transposon Tf2-6 polyprotein [Cucumis melo var. makuwa]
MGVVVTVAEYRYNSTFQRSLGVSPFQVLYGRKPPSFVSYGVGDTSNSSLAEQLSERDTVLAALRDHLLLAQQQMKQYADMKRRHVEYAIGDWVFLKIRPYRQLSLRKKRNEQLSSKFFGPYEVVGRVGPVAYKLDLPATTSIHPVFHVSQLKKFVGDKAGIQPTIQFLNENFEWQAQPEEALKYQKISNGGWEVLIRWKDLPEHEASWECYDEIQRLYPTFHLEDKVNLEGEGNVRRPLPPIKYRMLSRPYAFGCVLRLRTSTEFKPGRSYGHFFPDPQYENVQHIICCDSYATYAYDFEFANNVGFSRYGTSVAVFCAIIFPY